MPRRIHTYSVSKSVVGDIGTQQGHEQIQLEVASSGLADETTMPALDSVVGPNAAEEDGPMKVG